MATKYLTFSYDDGVRQDIRLTELFRRYGMKGTFNMNTGSLGHVGHIMHQGFDVCFDKVRADEVHNVYAGFEVAMHGVAHRNFPELTDAELDAEVCNNMKEIEALTGEKVVGGAYPCGVFDDTIADRLRARGIGYCRTIKDTHSFAVPTDFNIWHPTCHDNDDRAMELAEQFIALEAETPSVFYIWGHAFELDKPDRDRWYRMEKLLEKLAGHDDICYAENREIFAALAK